MARRVRKKEATHLLLKNKSKKKCINSDEILKKIILELRVGTERIFPKNFIYLLSLYLSLNKTYIRKEILFEQGNVVVYLTASIRNERSCGYQQDFL